MIVIAVWRGVVVVEALVVVVAVLAVFEGMVIDLKFFVKIRY